MRLSLALAVLLLTQASLASDLAGTIKTRQGAAYIVRGGIEIPANPGESLRVSDSIRTGGDGTVGITLLDDTRLTAGPNSTMELQRFVFDTTTNKGTLNARVKRGSLGVISGKIAKSSPEQVKFTTQSVTLGVRGTRFIIKAEE